MICLGDAVLHDVDYLGSGQTRVFLLDEEKVGILSIADVGEVALVDSVGVGDNPAGHCLAEYAGETHDGNPLGVDDVTEHVSYSDAGQLVDVTDKYQAHVDGNGLSREFIRMTSIMEHSSTMSAPPSKGFSSLRP